MNSPLTFSIYAAWFAFVGGLNAAAQSNKQDVDAWIDANRGEFETAALAIWSLAEVGFQEHRSSALLQQLLRQHGFMVESGVADIPTAFVATFGHGSPTIGILGEFDALPGVSQTATPQQESIKGQAAGHACGHHLFGAGSAAAAISIKNWLESTRQAGTIRFYGTPAEEGGSGKVYLARAGLFDSVDAVLHWHPSDRNHVWMSSSNANKSAKFRFRGSASHAAVAPHLGRSALDGIEAMNAMVNQLREHVPQETRIHYVITRGGGAPNVVPAFGESFYYVRHPRREVLHDIWQRVEQAARGAALGTGTSVDWEVIHGNHELLPNTALGRLMHGNLERVGGVTYDDTESAFARKLGPTFLGGTAPALEQAALVPPFVSEPPLQPGSTDVGDVSWLVPTVGVRIATWVPGTAPHTWQAVAAGGTSIGLKGMVVAAKVLALTAVDLYTSPQILAQAKAELQLRRGDSFSYTPLIGDRKPPLDYRD